MLQEQASSRMHPSLKCAGRSHAAPAPAATPHTTSGTASAASRLALAPLAKHHEAGVEQVLLVVLQRLLLQDLVLRRGKGSARRRMGSGPWSAQRMGRHMHP